jgi:endoglucanase Acf2
VLNEQLTQNTGSTVNTGTTTTTTLIPTGTTTNTNTGDTPAVTATTEPVSFGTDSNAISINKEVKKGFLQKLKGLVKRKPEQQVQTNESFNNNLIEEMNKMSYLLNYKRGVVLSEQTINPMELMKKRLHSTHL